MENWRKNSRKDIAAVDVDALVPKDPDTLKPFNGGRVPRQTAFA